MPSLDWINEHTLSLFFATVVFVLSPGPGVMVMLSRAMSFGFFSGFAVAMGAVLGDLVYVVGVLFSLSSVIDWVVPYLPYVRWVGAIYLAYLGVMLSVRPVGDLHRVHRDSWVKLFGLGLITSLTNPKVMVFYFGFFPLFMDSSTTTPQSLMGLFWAWLAGFMVASVIIPAVGHCVGRSPAYVNRLALMNKVLGVVMMGVAVVLVLP